MAALMRKKHFQKRRSLSFKLEKFSSSTRVSFSTTKGMLADAFSQFGHVTEATIIMDKGKNRSKGYGYVTFSTEEEAQKALADMNGKLLDGRVIFLDNVRPSRRYNTDAPHARQLPEEN
ncbi:hypothetical protein WN943_025951 [Citrus x changshan-huyou]